MLKVMKADHTDCSPSKTPVKPGTVDLVYLIRTCAMEKPFLIICVFVLLIKLFFFDHVALPKCAVLDSLNLKESKPQELHVYIYIYNFNTKGQTVSPKNSC